MAGAMDTVLLLQVVMNPQLSVEPAHRGRDGGELRAVSPRPPPHPILGRTGGVGPEVPLSQSSQCGKRVQSPAAPPRVTSPSQAAADLG